MDRPEKPKEIVSFMAKGNGAHILHKILEKNIPGYCVKGYHPRYTFFPFSLWALFPNKRARILHTSPDYAFFFHRNCIPLVLTFHNYVLDPWMRPYSSTLQRIHYRTDLRMWTRLALKRASVMTAVSRFTACIAQKDLNLTKPIPVIYNGVDIEHFVPSRTQKVLKNEIRVMFSGNLTRRKGVNWLPGILKRVGKNIGIYYTQGLRGSDVLAGKPGFHPLGPVPFRKMPNRYQQAQILLIPTVREGLSLAVLEAMACGLPVVASNCSSLPEQIDHGKGGFLCPVGDTNAFAAKINLLADSPGLRKEMGEYNRAKVEKMFTVERMVREYRKLFEEVLEQSPAF